MSFVLEIESEAPDAGEAPINSNPVPQEKVHQIFNTYITGNVQNVATGSSDFEQHTMKTEASPEVFAQLLDALQSVQNTEIANQLTKVIEEMRASHGTQGFKGNYQNFMSLLADHMQVLGPVVAPFLPALAALMP